jgi:DNA-binding winged helix-turn-helix (wHTH) protein
MSPQTRVPTRLVFGPFEVNVQTGDLSRSGHRVRLPEQPFQILLMMLEHPGDVVTRQQLCEQI